MRFSVSLFGHEIMTIDLARVLLVNLEGDDSEDEPKGIAAGSGGHFEVPFGFRSPDWFPNEYGQDPHQTSG